MTLYEYLKMTESDFDTYDTEYENGVTVCFIDEEDEEDEFDKFCNAIMKKVKVVNINGDVLVVNWCELIKRNLEKFKKFTANHWRKNCQYENNIDEFVYQWINEIHAYMAGYVSEDFYSTLNEFVSNLV